MPTTKPVDIYSEFSRNIRIGRVIDVSQHNHLYLVDVPNSAPLLCELASSINALNAGVKDHSMLLPGEIVLVISAGNINLILATIPTELVNPDYNFSDWIGVPLSGTTVEDSILHSLSLSMQPVPFNFNNSKPRDILPGDSGASSPFGVSHNLSLFSYYAKASDLCGVWLFYLDNLFKQAAYNYELWTAAKETTIREDSGENIEITRSSPYPWEMMGVKSPSREPFEKNDDPNIWRTDNFKNLYTPKEENQTLIPRLTELGGYLGDLTHSIISCPGSSAPEIETTDNPTNYIGLSEIKRHSNGLMEFRSNKGIVLEKSVFIPVPKQLKTPNDPEGDSNSLVDSQESEYAFAGINGRDKHDKSEFEGDEKYSNDSRSLIAMLFDELNWTRNKTGSVALREHKKDWHMSVETDIQEMHGPGHVALPMQTGKAFLSGLPLSVNVRIDDREGHTHTYYKARSIIKMMDNGDILIENGHGSSIQLVDQNIILDCAGDIIQKNGRNFTVMAPNDINLRAGNHVDVSADNGDLRLKAQKSLYAHASDGGILLETRSTGNVQEYNGLKGTDVKSTGIVLKAVHSDVDIYGLNLYANSVGGNITIDANYGGGDLNLYSAQQTAVSRDQNITLVGTTPDKTNNENARHVVVSPSSVSSDIPVVSLAGGVFCGDVVTGTLSEDPKEAARNSARDQEFNRTLKWQIETRTIGRGSPYELDNIKRDTSKPIGFTFRTSDQHGIDFSQDDFILFYESRWQQYYRQQNKGSTWVDKGVKPLNDQGQEIDEITQAFPGYEAWNQPRFGQYNFLYWDIEKGDSVSFDSDTKPTIIPVDLKNNYLVNYQQNA